MYCETCDNETHHCKECGWCTECGECACDPDFTSDELGIDPESEEECLN